MRFTFKFKVLLLVLFFLIIFGIVIDQFLLQKELNAQMKFDTEVMQKNILIQEQIYKITSSFSSKPSPTPFPSHKK